MSSDLDDEFPVMFIDPVYATVTSKASLRDEDFDIETWIKNSGLSGGIIKFISPIAVYKKATASYFVKMSKDTSTDLIAEYMDKAWKLRSPSIILSVISSPGYGKKWMNQRQKEDFQKGIIEAVNTTSIWILTNGTHSGVSKLIGDAIKMEKERRHLLATNYDRKCITTTRLENLPRITAIGILPISQLSHPDEFTSEETEITIDLKTHGEMSMTESVELNPNLTNFILLDEIANPREENSQKLSLEERLRLTIGKPNHYDIIYEDDTDLKNKPKTPMVGVLIQGSPSDIEHVCDLVKMKVPVVIFKGTGSGAELFSFAYEEIKKRPDEDHLHSYVKPELLKRIQKIYPKEFKNDNLARNRCRDMIIECVHFSLEGKQNYLTILDIDTDPNGLKNLDKYILMALFDSQEPKKNGTFKEQIQSDLKLTLDWNRSDIAASQIFQKFDWINIKIGGDLFDLALIRKDRHNFVELFLDQQAIELHRYFSLKRFLYLINHYEDPEFFRTICIGEILGNSPLTDYPVSKRFVSGSKSSLNLILYKTTYLSSLVSFEDFGMEFMESDIIRSAIAERKAVNTLVYWAALNYDPELTKTLWKRTEEPVAMALVINMIWHRMSKRWCPDSDLKRKLRASAEEFGKMAVQLLEYSYQDSNFNTIALLDKKLEDFNNKTIIELAHMANNKNFIAHYVCQKWLKRRWFGNLLITKLDWGPIKIPNWVKIYLCIVFIFPMFFWVTYDLADKKRRDKIREDDFDEHTLLEEPVPTNASVFVNRWLVKPSETLAYKMRSVWNYGRERFKVPVHLQFYYLWSAPITKFWLNQIFYIVFLMLFSVATLHPNCGLLYLDLAVFAWVLTIWLELVRSTLSKWRKYIELDLFWTVCEIIVMACLLLVILTVRITPYFVSFFTYTDTKFLMSLGLIYFYYRVLVVFLPISPVLGPMLISIKRMITHDFLTWIRMFLIIMVSGAIAIQSVLYPNFPLIPRNLKMALSRAFFAMFLTKIDDLDGNSCTYKYKDSTVSHCYSEPNGTFFKAFYTDNFNATTHDEKEYYELSHCAYSGVGGYFVVIQYLLIVKLIMITLLYALFSSTNQKIQKEAEAIWKFQKYSLIVDFEEKLILPPPLNCISYLVMIIQCIVRFIKYCYRRCCKHRSNCCRKKGQMTPLKSFPLDASRQVSVLTLQKPEDYSYWASFVRKLADDEDQEQADKKINKTQCQTLDSLKNQFAEQKEFNGRLVEQISSVEHNVTNCQLSLEQLQHIIETIYPHLQPDIVTNNKFLHVLSRQSPYPQTTVQRFPVFDKYVPWETPYGTYDPVVYTCPVENYSEKKQQYVDKDFLKFITDSKLKTISLQNLRAVEAEIGAVMPAWNSSHKFNVNGKQIITDRTSFIKDNGVPIKYKLDTCNLPLNPRGRTGVRGRGKLLKWGPNHNAMIVITRLKKKENSVELMLVDQKRVLEVIAIQKTNNGDFSLPRAGDCGYMSMYSAVCQKFMKYTAEDTSIQVKTDMDDKEMIKFFREFFTLPGYTLSFTTNMIYKGYFDDPTNTDNAWREVEVWNLHFDEGGKHIDLKLKNKEKKWKTVSSYNLFHGSQDLILRKTATLHNAYY